MTKSEEISKATQEKPYVLWENKYIKYYTYNLIVFQQYGTIDMERGFEEKIIEIEIHNADPFSFEVTKGGMVHDKNYVFATRLAENSPPEHIKKIGGMLINNPKATYEYYIVKGADGSSFEYVRTDADKVHYKDKNATYYYDLKDHQFYKKK